MLSMYNDLKYSIIVWGKITNNRNEILYMRNERNNIKDWHKNIFDFERHFFRLERVSVMISVYTKSCVNTFKTINTDIQDILTVVTWSTSVYVCVCVLVYEDLDFYENHCKFRVNSFLILSV